MSLKEQHCRPLAPRFFVLIVALLCAPLATSQESSQETLNTEERGVGRSKSRTETKEFVRYRSFKISEGAYLTQAAAHDQCRQVGGFLATILSTEDQTQLERDLHSQQLIAEQQQQEKSLIFKTPPGSTLSAEWVDTWDQVALLAGSDDETPGVWYWKYGPPPTRNEIFFTTQTNSDETQIPQTNCTQGFCHWLAGHPKQETSASSARPIDRLGIMGGQHQFKWVSMRNPVTKFFICEFSVEEYFPTKGISQTEYLPTYYRHFENPYGLITPDSAERQCNSLGGWLAIVTSEAEMNKLKQDVGLRTIGSESSSELSAPWGRMALLGGADLWPSPEGSWYWRFGPPKLQGRTFFRVRMPTPAPPETRTPLPSPPNIPVATSRAPTVGQTSNTNLSTTSSATSLPPQTTIAPSATHQPLETLCFQDGEYCPWAPGEPNNEGFGEHTLYLDQNFQWIDESSYETSHYICQFINSETRSISHTHIRQAQFRYEFHVSARGFLSQYTANEQCSEGRGGWLATPTSGSEYADLMKAINSSLYELGIAGATASAQQGGQTGGGGGGGPGTGTEIYALTGGKAEDGSANRRWNWELPPDENSKLLKDLNGKWYREPVKIPFYDADSLGFNQNHQQHFSFNAAGGGQSTTGCLQDSCNWAQWYPTLVSKFNDDALGIVLSPGYQQWQWKNVPALSRYYICQIPVSGATATKTVTPLNLGGQSEGGSTSGGQPVKPGPKGPETPLLGDGSTDSANETPNRLNTQETGEEDDGSATFALGPLKGTSGLVIVLVTILVLFGLCCCCCYWFCHRRRKAHGAEAAIDLEDGREGDLPDGRQRSLDTAQNALRLRIAGGDLVDREGGQGEEDGSHHRGFDRHIIATGSIVDDSQSTTIRSASRNRNSRGGRSIGHSDHRSTVDFDDIEMVEEDGANEDTLSTAEITGRVVLGSVISDRPPALSPFSAPSEHVYNRATTDQEWSSSKREPPSSPTHSPQCYGRNSVSGGKLGYEDLPEEPRAAGSFPSHAETS